MAVIKRHSFLKRHAGMSEAHFSRHYLDHHGPLAAGLGGFRQYAFRYEQNHLDEDLAGAGDPPFDGLTMTFQVPREDYRRGFFQHPDYAQVRPDEEYLFDLSATVSVLGEEEVVLSGEREGEKAIILSSGGNLRSDVIEKYRVRRAVCNHLDTKTATALGFGKSAFAYELLWEVFFPSSDERRAACRDSGFMAGFSCPSTEVQPLALAAREFVIF